MDDRDRPQRSLNMDNTDCVGAGWAPLVKVLDNYAVMFGYKTDQVKEKFGGLRYYFHYTNVVPESEPFYRMRAFEAFVEAAENLSLHTCERCGAPGKLRTNRRWLKTLCDQHQRESEQK